CSLRESFYAATADKQARAMRNRTCSRPSHAVGVPGETSYHRTRCLEFRLLASRPPIGHARARVEIHRRAIKDGVPTHRVAAIDIDCSATKAYRPVCTKRKVPFELPR